MTAATLVLVIIGAYVAFRAGSRWRHNKLAWADARVTKAKWQVLKKFRWVTFRAAVLGVVVMVVYLFVSGAISLHIGHDDAVPTHVGHTRTTTPTPHQSSAPQQSAKPTPTPDGSH